MSPPFRYMSWGRHVRAQLLFPDHWASEKQVATPSSLRLCLWVCLCCLSLSLSLPLSLSLSLFLSRSVTHSLSLSLCLRLCLSVFFFGKKPPSRQGSSTRAPWGGGKQLVQGEIPRCLKTTRPPAPAACLWRTEAKEPS